MYGQAGTKVIHLDPGHGGPDDRGAVHDGTEESIIYLAVARQLNYLQVSEGFYVTISRANDVSVTLDRRVARSDFFCCQMSVKHIIFKE